MCSFSGEATLPFFASLLNGVQLLKERICCVQNKVFPVRVKASSFKEVKTKPQKFFPFVKTAEKTWRYTHTLLIVSGYLATPY